MPVQGFPRDQYYIEAKPRLYAALAERNLTYRDTPTDDVSTPWPDEVYVICQDILDRTSSIDAFFANCTATRRTQTQYDRPILVFMNLARSFMREIQQNYEETGAGEFAPLDEEPSPQPRRTRTSRRLPPPGRGRAMSEAQWREAERLGIEDQYTYGMPTGITLAPALSVPRLPGTPTPYLTRPGLSTYPRARTVVNVHQYAGGVTRTQPATVQSTTAGTGYQYGSFAPALAQPAFIGW